jgi:hypothetical protein
MFIGTFCKLISQQFINFIASKWPQRAPLPLCRGNFYLVKSSQSGLRACGRLFL